MNGKRLKACLEQDYLLKVLQEHIRCDCPGQMDSSRRSNTPPSSFDSDRNALELPIIYRKTTLSAVEGVETAVGACGTDLPPTVRD